VAYSSVTTFDNAVFCTPKSDIQVLQPNASLGDNTKWVSRFFKKIQAANKATFVFIIAQFIFLLCLLFSS
jgi:hypothetical protein